MVRIEERVFQVARQQAGRLAVEDGETAWSYGELLAASERVAVDLSRLGVKQGETVALLVSNRAADLAAFLGCWRVGAVSVPLHRSLAPEKSQALRQRVGAVAVVDKSVQETAHSGHHLSEMPDGVGNIVFTSGSTGEPKGVMLSAERAASKLDMIAGQTGWQEGQSTLVPLQLIFSFGQWATWLSLSLGGTVHLRSRLGEDSLELLSKGRVQRFALVPTMMRHMLASGASGAWRGSFMAGGEVLPAALGRRMLSEFPNAQLGDIYGLTETGTCDFFVQPHEYLEQAGTIGCAGQGIDIKLLEGGELAIRSPWGMLGYLGRPDLTEAAFEEGWFKTGDLARIRGDGVCELIGRAKEIVNRGGNKIAPLEIEAVFSDHPDVEAALACGVASDKVGEALHVALVPRAGVELRLEAVRDWASERLERFKLPDGLYSVPVLPTGNTGKADRGALRRLIESENLTH